KRQVKGACGILLTVIAFGLGGYAVPVGPVQAKPLSLGVDWLILAFLGSTIIFTTLEKLFPKYREQVILRREWGLDLFYFIFNHLIVSAVLLVGNFVSSQFDWAASSNLQEWVRSMPLILQAVFLMICADFVLYWEHRIFHEVPRLWPVHAVHHSVETMDWLAGSRGHVVQVFVERSLVMIPLYVIGADKAALDLYVTFAALQAITIHCYLGLPFGPVKYLLVTPQFHHWHHSSEKPAIDTNYSAHTPLFDRLFGTYHMPDAHWPADYGTTQRLPRTYWGQLLYPFRCE
ncbi:MAG: sterol desaturase family protein, partial [Burkholderiaceae bacterium]